MKETTNEIQPQSDPLEQTVTPLALDPLGPIPSADTFRAEHPLALDPLGPIRRFG
ncbi:MAG TPA: hypothetical protein VN606_11930 [Thermoleophilaceae bacterium]|jgi:hypothetical protein|nr:hypothetical protein [Thermoleophilaceae bacterium]